VSTDTTPTRAPDVPHGTLRGWSLGCRCMFCKSAKAATTEADSDTGTLREGRTR
jgi:hypothetical protein